MSENDAVNLYLDMMVANKLYSSKNKLEFHLHQLLERVDFSGKRVLDIGGGSGLYSFYAASQGASRVVCLEPEGDGSTKHITEKFYLVDSLLNCGTVFLETALLQEYSVKNTQYDVIMLLNAVNHLDEGACINLINDESAQNIYTTIFAKIYQLASHGSTLIVSDCSPRNFWSDMGLNNPFVPTIEWHKHQHPETWIRLLYAVGFSQPNISWTSFNRAGRLGKYLTGNRLMAYFLHSHFCFTMRKS
jgi:16S rRNA G966 N2-methylase RsmD